MGRILYNSCRAVGGFGNRIMGLSALLVVGSVLIDVPVLLAIDPERYKGLLDVFDPAGI
jgi:hypothetical protein